jgi:hypothetical protein
MLEIVMQIRMENQTGIRKGRFVKYEYGMDLFGNIYLDKIKGREKGKLVDRWLLQDFGSLFRVLDLELYKREVENYENILTTRPAFQ